MSHKADKSVEASTDGKRRESVPPVPSQRSRVMLATVLGHQETNPFGAVQGGIVMQLIDDAGAAAAGRHAGVPALTVAVESMEFFTPPHVGDVLSARAEVTEVGSTSMRVDVVVTAQLWGEDVVVERIATGRLVFVAVDQDGQVVPVPPLIPAGDDWLRATSWPIDNSPKDNPTSPTPDNAGE